EEFFAAPDQIASQPPAPAAAFVVDSAASPAFSLDAQLVDVEDVIDVVESASPGDSQPITFASEAPEPMLTLDALDALGGIEASGAALELFTADSGEWEIPVVPVLPAGAQASVEDPVAPAERAESTTDDHIFGLAVTPAQMAMEVAGAEPSSEVPPDTSGMTGAWPIPEAADAAAIELTAFDGDQSAMFASQVDALAERATLPELTGAVDLLFGDDINGAAPGGLAAVDDVTRVDLAAMDSVSFPLPGDETDGPSVEPETALPVSADASIGDFELEDAAALGTAPLAVAPLVGELARPVAENDLDWAAEWPIEEPQAIGPRDDAGRAETDAEDYLAAFAPDDPGADDAAPSFVQPITFDAAPFDSTPIPDAVLDVATLTGRARVAALEQFLRRIELRRLQVAGESVV
ncbi:MAG: hypothetical protein ABI652_04665, partial [Acidobacteriota bacterium]